MIEQVTKRKEKISLENLIQSYLFLDTHLYAILPEIKQTLEKWINNIVVDCLL